MQAVLGAVGSAFFGPVGGAIGSMIGGMLDAGMKEIQGPRVGDMKVPQVQYGAKLLRLYGANRTSGLMAWYSEKREIESSTGGCLEPEVTTFSSEIDVLYILSYDSSVIGVTRVWRNGELVWTQHADSDGASIAASAQTGVWTAMRFLDGNPDQMPDPTIEASEGAGNAPAYLYRQCVMIEGLQLGQSGQMPLMEFECVTGGTAAGTTIEAWHTDAASLIGGVVAFSSGSHEFHMPEWDNTYYTNLVRVYRVQSGQEPVQIGTYNVANQYRNIQLGQSDESGLVQFQYGSTSVEFYRTNAGALTTYILPTATTEGVFCKRGDYFYWGSNLAGAPLYRFSEAGGGPQASNTSTGMPDSAYCIAASATKVYAIPRNNTATLVYVFDALTLAFLESFAVPAGTVLASSAEIYCDGAGQLYFLSTSNTLYKRVGATWELFLSWTNTMPTGGGGSPWGGDGTQRGGFGTGGLYKIVHDSGSSGVGEWVVRTTITIGTVDLADIIRKEWDRVGDSATDIDASALEGIPVRGFQTSGSVRAANEALAAIYHFGAAPPSPKLRYVRQGGAIVATLPFGDLAAGENEASDVAFDPERGNDGEVAEGRALTYPNYADDYANGTETASRGVTTSTIVSTAETNVVMTPAEAKAVTETWAAQAGIEKTTGQITLSDYWAPLEPTDRIAVPDEDGTVHQMRIKRTTYGGGVKQADLVLDDPTTLVAPGITFDAYTQALTVAAPAAAEIVLFDTSIFRDADNGPGIYVASKGQKRGATIYESTDGVAFPDVVATVAKQAVFGVATTTLANWTGGNVVDETNKVTVDVGAGTLTDSTFDAMIADKTINTLLVGAEIIRFIRRTVVDTGIYTLSGLFRAQYGTEWAMASHGADETVVLLRNAGIRRIAHETGDLGALRYYKGVSAGRPLSSANAETFTDDGVSLMPYAVVDLERTVTGVAWHRRSRLSSVFLAPGIDPPLGEATEAYDVELRDGSDVLIATDRVTSPAWDGAAFGLVFSLDRAGADVRLVGSNLASIRDVANTSTSAVDIQSQTTGAAVSGYVTGEQTKQLADNGSVLFAATINGSLTSHVFRLNPAAMGSPTHTYAGTLAADCQGVAYDGTNVWISEFYSGRVRKLSAADLSVSASTTVSGAPARMFYDGSGSLWVCAKGGLDIVQVTTSTGVIAQRIPVGAIPFDVLVANGIVFVQTSTSVQTFNATTGAAISTISLSGIASTLPMFMALYDGDVVTADYGSGELVFIDATTGLFARRAVVAGLKGVSGVNGSDLFVTAEALAGSVVVPTTSAYGETDLAGHSVTVYPISATIGRGHPATLEL